MMRRSEIRRTSSLSRQGAPLRRTPMKVWKPKTSVVRRRRSVYELVDARASGVCEMCGRLACVPEHSHRSHAGHGGSPASLRASNLVLACRRCNRDLSDDAEVAYIGRRLGWLIRRGDDPTTTPFWHAVWGWVLLDDEGGWTPTEGAAS